MPPYARQVRLESVKPVPDLCKVNLCDGVRQRVEFAPAMHQLLEIVKRDRTFRDDVARRKLLAVFEMAAEHPDLVAEYRSRLSSLLF